MPGIKHGKTKTRTYKVWLSLRSRHKQRGLPVCKRWVRFDVFLKDMGRCPKGKGLGRINGKRPYSPSNCKWRLTAVNVSDQSWRSRVFTLDGRSLPIEKWAAELGITRQAIDDRLNRGWSVREALTTRHTGLGLRPGWKRRSAQ
jgi:hypothetical protein